MNKKELEKFIAELKQEFEPCEVETILQCLKKSKGGE